ncbi:hypothetical protein ACIPC1_20530 [Streptomyces sp. NPDC087263]|uniref:hypothetical protein n=1 Tax=Streptomyces sp. NPDC087263 TaxID=3365773 RepID=UPI0038007417
MRDEDVTEPEASLRLLEEADRLRLRGHLECRHRFLADEDLRAEGATVAGRQPGSRG